MPASTRHILTVEVEDYYQVGAFRHLIPFGEWERFEHRLRRNLDRTIELLEAYDASATFFVSGWIAEKHPEVCRTIAEAGHEIGAQGYYQQSIREIPPPAFGDDIRRSKLEIEAVTAREVHGFRIGRGWLGPDDLWALDIIREQGFRYDASLCPLGRQFSGEPTRFHIDRHACSRGELIEIPVSCRRVAGYALPCAGGNYLRQLPAWLSARAASEWVARGEPLVAYFHIWELDEHQPSITAAGILQRVRHYRNLDVMRERIAALLERFAFTSAGDYLGLRAAATASTAPAERAAAEPQPPGFVPATNERRALTVIVPCFNEEASIPYLRRTLEQFTQRAAPALDLRFVFVDDGSTDATWEKLGQAFGEQAGARLLRQPHNRGIAAAIVAGAAAAETDLVAVIDADCTFDPNTLLEMLPLMTDDVSVVVASPFHRGGGIRHVPGWRLLLSRGAAAMYRALLHNKLTSYTSCFRIYRRHLIADMRLDDEGFCGVSEIIARLDLAGHRVVETPAVLQIRLLGESKIRLLQVTANHLRLLARVLMARLRSAELG